MKFSLLLLGCFFSYSSVSAQSLYTQNSDGTIKHWHWENSVANSDIAQLANRFKTQPNEMDEILTNFTTQLDSLTINFNDDGYCRRYLTNAEKFSNAKYYLTQDESLAFEAMGDMMMEQLFHQLTTAIKEKNVPSNSPEITYLVMRLADNNKYIDLPESNTGKAIRHLKNGDVKYVWHKLTTTYWPEFRSFILLGTLFLVCVLVFFRAKRRSKTQLN